MEAFKDYIEIPSFDHDHDITNDGQETAINIGSTSVPSFDHDHDITNDGQETAINIGSTSVPSFDHDHDITNDGQETAINIGSTSVNLPPSSFITPASLVEKRAGMFTTSITSSTLSTRLINTNIRSNNYHSYIMYTHTYIPRFIYMTIHTYIHSYVQVYMYM